MVKGTRPAETFEELPEDLGPLGKALATLNRAVEVVERRQDAEALEPRPLGEKWDEERLLAEITELEQRAVIRLGQLQREWRGTSRELSVHQTIAVLGAKVRMSRRAKQGGAISRPRAGVQEDLAAEVSELAAGEDPDAEPADG